MVLDQSWPVCLSALGLSSKFSNIWNIDWIQCSDGEFLFPRSFSSFAYTGNSMYLAAPYTSCFLYFLNKSIKCVLLCCWDPNGNFRWVKRHLKCIVGDYRHRALGFLACSYAVWLWEMLCSFCWFQNRNRWTQCSFMEKYCTALGSRTILFTYFVYLCSTWKSALAHDWISQAHSQCGA